MIGSKRASPRLSPSAMSAICCVAKQASHELKAEKNGSDHDRSDIQSTIVGAEPVHYRHQKCARVVPQRDRHPEQRHRHAPHALRQ
ncbi:hypothetical protein U1Q18_017267 [Sarracenia purpurea var. burkii]